MTKLPDNTEAVNLTPEYIEEYYRTAMRDWSSQPHDMLPRFEKALEMSREIGFKKGEAYCLGLIGYHYFFLSQLDKALQYLNESRSLAEEDGDPETIATAMSVLGMIHRSLGNLDESFSLISNANRILKTIDEIPMHSWLLYSLAGNYQDFGDYDKAKETYGEALSGFRRQKESREDADRADIGVARCLNGIASVLQGQNRHDEALEYHLEAQGLFESLNNEIGVARVLNDIGEIYRAQGDLEKAEEHHRRALELRQNLTMKQALATSLINLGRVLTAKGEHDEGMGLLHRALTVAMEIKAKVRIYEANLALANSYEQAGEFEHALEHFKMYHDAREVVYSDEANARVRNLQIGHEVESAEQNAEIERLKNVELREKNEQLEQLVNELTATQQQLVQSEKMAALGSLVAGLVHEMNTPLGALMSSSDVNQRYLRRIDDIVAKVAEIEPRFSENILLLKENNRNAVAALDRLAKLFKNLRTFVRLDEAAFQRADIHEGLESSLELLGIGQTSKIEVVKNYGSIPNFGHYPGEMNQVFMTLLKNAIEAIGESGTVEIRTSLTNSKVTIAISDTGRGIPAAQLEHVFEPSFSSKGSRIKSGMGLFSAYNTVRKHNGEIRIDSALEKGTRVTIELPTDLQPNGN